MRKLYLAQRKEEVGGVDCIVICFNDTKVIKRYPLKHIERHSPDGFNFGFEGSGPADLALSILTDFLEDRAAAELVYQEFKRAHIATHKGNALSILGFQIRNWIEKNFPQIQIPVEAR
jgi:hypothetical protein